MKTLVFLLVLDIYVRGSFSQLETYKAAVLEYEPKLSGITVADNILENTREYLHYMQQAADQGVQIIVFPEDGLTAWRIDWSSLKQLSTEVPDPIEQIAPCTNSTYYSNYPQFFVDLSCAAQHYGMYTVVNLIERHQENNIKRDLYYKTNVVFDNNGVIIARYRKINLDNESFFAPGPNTVSVFETNFGVTFGMLISKDVLFKTPALDVLLNRSVTDVVYSTSWSSDLPFLEALSVQHGYAKSNGVNLLVAGLNDPANRRSGSGVYLADGRIIETYISGEKSSKLIVQGIPKIIVRRDLSEACQSASESPQRKKGTNEIDDEVILYRTKESDLTHFTFKSLKTNYHNKLIKETICSGKSFCCSFNLTIIKNPRIWPNYVYKLIAFSGVSKLSATKTIGLRNCGLVACLNESNSSCGRRHVQPPEGLAFDSISIKGTFSNKHSHEQPSTLKFDLTPATDYMYCTKKFKDEIEIKLVTTKRHDSLLTFGIFGRFFGNDDQTEGVINSASICCMNMYFVFVISVLVFLKL